MSYVLNNGPRPVASATRARVLQAMEELGYQPNLLARALRAQRTNAVGLVVPDSANPYFSELAKSIERAAYARGRVLLLGNAGYSIEHEHRYLETLANMRVDGLLLVHAELPSGEPARPPSVDVPLVYVSHPAPPGTAAASVVHDNEAGGYLATRHLIEHGHPHVACLTGPASAGPVASRAAGWRRAVGGEDRSGGRPADGELLASGGFDRYSAYRLACSWLPQRGRAPALFAATDELAIGVLRAAAELRVAVPEELAIVGFDGIAETGFTLPALTTVHHPIDAMGAVAVETLFGAGNGAGDRTGDVVLPTTLIRRHSCGCAG